jgi:hypothetical protein
VQSAAQKKNYFVTEVGPFSSTTRHARKRESTAKASHTLHHCEKKAAVVRVGTARNTRTHTRRNAAHIFFFVFLFFRNLCTMKMPTFDTAPKEDKVYSGFGKNMMHK